MLFTAVQPSNTQTVNYYVQEYIIKMYAVKNYILQNTIIHLNSRISCITVLHYTPCSTILCIIVDYYTPKQYNSMYYRTILHYNINNYAVPCVDPQKENYGVSSNNTVNLCTFMRGELLYCGYRNQCLIFCKGTYRFI